MAALLEGRIILDNLGLALRLKRLKEELERKGAYISKKGIKFPEKS